MSVILALRNWSREDQKIKVIPDHEMSLSSKATWALSQNKTKPRNTQVYTLKLALRGGLRGRHVGRRPDRNQRQWDQE